MRITRQLVDTDYDQVIDLTKERGAAIIELKKAKIKNQVPDDANVDEISPEAWAKWEMLVRDYYLKGVTQKLIGTFDDDKLMSMCGMRFAKQIPEGWILCNLKARNLPLSENGMRDTMAALYQHAKDIGKTEYYCCMATYRHKKFKVFLKKLVPEYYNEYEEEILEIVPAGQQPSEDLWWGMMGRKLTFVDVIIKKMKCLPT